MYYVLYNYRKGLNTKSNTNVQKNPQGMPVCSYIMFLWLLIIESILNACVLPSYTFTNSYDTTYEDIFAPDYLLVYPTQVSL